MFTPQDDFDLQRLHTLCGNLLEDNLSLTERDELEQIVLRSSAAQRIFLDYTALHAVVTSYFRVTGNLPPSSTANADAKKHPFFPGSIPAAGNEASRRTKSRWALQSISTIALSCLFLLSTALFSWYWIYETNQDDSFGTIEGIPGVQSSRWDKSSSALRPDNRLGPGELHFLSGIGIIHYDHGATLIIHGPSHLTLQSRDDCFLHRGNVSAQVVPTAIGFTVQTSVAAIKDLGTEFGVSVGENDHADVRVFSGRVDVSWKERSNVIPITSGGWLQFGDQISEPHADLFARSVSADQTIGGTTCSTADPNGQEACVMLGGDPDRLSPKLISRSNIFTLIKNSYSSDHKWNRKAYISIDLSKLSKTSFRDVQLELVFAPTGVGYLDYIPETSVFSVYGLTTESLDNWDETTINWDNAPANLHGGNHLDLNKVVKIASFEIPRAQEACQIVLSNDRLRSFLASDTDRRVTFIVVRDTQETKDWGYAHGFANRRHPDLPPPTLRFFQ